MGQFIWLCFGILVVVGRFLLIVGLLAGLILTAVSFYRVWAHPDRYMRSLKQNVRSVGLLIVTSLIVWWVIAALTG